MKKEPLFRGGIYLSGIMILAMGVMLSTKTAMGVTPITAPAFALASGLGVSFPVMVFGQYIVMVVLEFLIDGRERQWKNLLQVPFAVVFSSFLNWFGALFSFQVEPLWQRVLLLAVATVCISVGASMMVAMRLITNPADALYMSMSRRWKRDPGLMKNILDIACVALAAVIDLLFGRGLVSVGVGTVTAMILVGRIVYLFNRLCRDKLMELAGLTP